MEHLIVFIGFILAMVGASFLGVVATVYAIKYWEGLF